MLDNTMPLQEHYIYGNIIALTALTIMARLRSFK
jgi:hypothetical protein